MFAPLGALSGFGSGLGPGIEEGQIGRARYHDLLGMQALGRAFQDMTPPTGQTPSPGQPSQPLNMAPPAQTAGGPAPPGPPRSPPQPGGAPLPQGMFDLQTLAQRIKAANPNLPPEAMFAALNRAVPMLNVQGRQQLLQLRRQYQQQMMDYRMRQLRQKGGAGASKPRARNAQGDELEWDGQNWVSVEQ